MIVDAFECSLDVGNTSFVLFHLFHLRSLEKYHSFCAVDACRVLKY